MMRPLPCFKPAVGPRWGLLLLMAFPPLACGGGGYTAAPTVAASTTPESVWEALNRPRPEPLPGAARVTVSEILLLADPWRMTTPVPSALGIQELISAGLLRRQDVEFVERRRFAQAAEMERRGQRRPRGAPPVGVSPGAELVLQGSWAPAGTDSSYLDFRVTDAETGQVVNSFRRSTPRGADPTAVARQAVAGLLETLRDMGRLPSWNDPFPQGAPETFRASGVSLEAVGAFFAGVAAEDRYDWEGALTAYQKAADAGGANFPEAQVALARIARIRAGGSLGSGDSTD